MNDIEIFHKLTFCRIFTFRYTDEYKECLIVPTKGKYMKKAIAWAFPIKSPFLNIFNFYFQKFKDRGIWKSIEDRYKNLPQECPDLSGKSVDFDSCFTAFLALLVGISFSFFIILIECQKGRLNKAAILKQNNVSKDGECSKIPQDIQNKIEEKIKSQYDRISDHYDTIDNLKAQLQNIKQTNMNKN